MNFNAFRKVALPLQRFVGNLSLLRRWGRRTVERTEIAQDLPTLFIIGPPRSGSTLLSQLLVSHFTNVAYISNIVSLFFGSPVWVTRRLRRFIPRYEGDHHSSSFGYVSGLWAPSEAGPLFTNWFGHSISSVDIPPEQREQVRRSVKLIGEAMGGPLLIKSMKLSLKITDIAEMIPDSIFIYIKRDAAYSVQSILQTRQKINGNYDDWWSYPVEGVEELVKMDPFDQVANQLRIINDCIESAATKIADERFLRIEYEALCENPHQVLDEVAARLKARGVELKQRDQALPELKRQSKITLSDDEWGKVQAALQKAST